MACLLHNVGHSPFSHTGEKHNRTLKTGVRGDWSEYRQENFNVIDLSTLDQEPEKATTYTHAKKIKAF